MLSRGIDSIQLRTQAASENIDSNQFLAQGENHSIPNHSQINFESYPSLGPGALKLSIRALRSAEDTMLQNQHEELKQCLCSEKLNMNNSCIVKFPAAGLHMPTGGLREALRKYSKCKR